MGAFVGKLKGFKLAKNAWSDRFNRDLQRLVRNSAREWLRSVITTVPVWTGMALGGFKFANGTNGNLARFLNVAIPINPIDISGGTFVSPFSGKRVHLDKRKTPEAGGELASYSFKFTKNHTFSFEFENNVPHFMHNEFFERTDWGAGGQQIMAPWHSLEKARAAFFTYLRNEIKEERFSRIKQYIIRTKVSSSHEATDVHPTQGSAVQVTDRFVD